MSISARTVAKVIVVAIAVVASLYLLWLIRSVIGTLFISIFLAVALGPAVDFFQNRCSSLSPASRCWSCRRSSTRRTIS
jgi:predicted PurR-regulated permease PerM